MSSSSIIQPAARPVADVRGAIARASARTGIDFGYMMQKAALESGFDSDAKAKTSSAAGLYQFTESTWLETVRRHGHAHGLGWAADAARDPAQREAVLALRFDPEAASTMAAELAADNAALLGARLGRPLESVDLYLAHFLGAKGAADFLAAHAREPESPAAPSFAAAAAANRPIFYDSAGRARSYAEIRDRFAARLARASGAPALPEAAPVSRLQIARRDTRAAPPLTMQPMLAMPGRLSLGFAQDAYRRLSGTGGAA